MIGGHPSEETHRRHREELEGVLGPDGGSQVSTVGELLQLLSRLPPSLPFTIDPVLRGVGSENTDDCRSVAIGSTVALGVKGPQGQIGFVPAVECFGLTAPAGTFPDGVPRKHRLPPVDECTHSKELARRGLQGESMVVLARHLFEIAEHVGDQPDLPEGSPELREAHDIGVVLHEQVQRLEELAPTVLAANMIVDVFF